MPMSERVVLLAGDGPSTRMVYHALRKRYDDVVVVLEEGPRRRQMLLRRVRTLGPVTVFGQLLFLAAVLPVLRRSSAGRIAEIEREFGLDGGPLEGARVVRIPSVNSPEARAALKELGPRVVVVNGTRIISARTLAATAAPFINTHAGITPLYRGVHGGYWALADGRADLAGTTVHLVDKGIDTGAVVGQAPITPTRADSFATYPHLHTAAGVPILMEAVAAALDGTLTATQNPRGLPSTLRSHPTIWGYLYRRVRSGVR